MGEVDYTNGRIIKTITYSAIENTNININDLNKVTNIVKDTISLATVHFKSSKWKRLSIIAVLNVKSVRSLCTNVLFPRLRPSMNRGKAPVVIVLLT